MRPGLSIRSVPRRTLPLMTRALALARDSARPRATRSSSARCLGVFTGAYCPVSGSSGKAWLGVKKWEARGRGGWRGKLLMFFFRVSDFV